MIAAIADIHGQLDALCRLLAHLKSGGIEFARDQLVFLGDYVDGGPDSRRVVDLLIDLEQEHPHWIFLLGNHEDMLLNALADPREWQNWYNQGGRATLQSYAHEPGGRFTHPAMANLIPTNHIEWMRSRPLIFETKSFIFVHGGLDPDVADVRDNTRETLLWIREPFVFSRRNWGKRIIFGHTHFPKPLVMPNKIGIDAGDRREGELFGAILKDSNSRFLKLVSSRK